MNDWTLQPNFICKKLAVRHLPHVSQFNNNSGFSAPYLHVKIDGNFMEVTHFSEDGKMHEQTFLTPISEEDFIKKINHPNYNNILTAKVA